MKDNNLKILIIAGKINSSNGAFHSLYSNLKEFKKYCIEPIVVLSKNDEINTKIQQLGIKTIIFPYCSCTVPNNDNSIKKKMKGLIKGIINSFFELKIKKIIIKEKIKLLYINVSTCSFGAKSAIECRIPLVWHLREFLEEDVNMTYFNKKNTVILLRKANKLIAITNAVKNHFEKVYSLKNIEVVYNGIFDEKFKISYKVINKNKKIVFTIIGRIIEEKGQYIALKAFKKLYLENKNIFLNIVGKVGNQEYYNSMIKFVCDNDLNNNVCFLPHTNNLKKIWENTNVGLICSKKEGFGRVTAELMINSIPIIGANTGGTLELLDHDRGLLYEQNSVDDLKEKMNFCINNIDKLDFFTYNAYEYAKNNFSTYNCADNIMKIFKDSLNDFDRGA